MIGVLLVFAAVAGTLSVRRLKRAGFAPSAAFRPSIAIVEVGVDEEVAEALCKRALLEVNETLTSYDFEHRKLEVLSHVDKNPGTLHVRFELEPADDNRTRVLVALTSGRGQLNVEMTRKRHALTGQLADWLAEHGNGRVVQP